MPGAEGVLAAALADVEALAPDWTPDVRECEHAPLGALYVLTPDWLTRLRLGDASGILEVRP